MPPHVPRKRLRDPSPTGKSKSSSSASRLAHSPAATRRKPTLYDDLDATSAPKPGAGILDLAGDDSDSSLSSLSEGDFEDVPLAKRQKTDDDDGDDSDDDVEFEDVEAPAAPAPDAPVTSGDLELTLTRDSRISLVNTFGSKKGPTKREKNVRHATHCVHVQSLLWHNAIRNSWLCDSEVQAIMLSHLPPRMWEGVERWRRNSGLTNEPPSTNVTPKAKGKWKRQTETESRHWGTAATKLEEGVVDMSHGDPLFRLVQPLVSWWKQRFRVTTPGLRKLGYMPLERLDRITKAYEKGEGGPEEFGERIASLEEFCQCAQKCEGSRDVGAQLFTALLRGLGLETRMVANVQALGFGWTKLEEAEPEPETSDALSKKTTDIGVTPVKKQGKAANRPTTPRASGSKVKREAFTPKGSRSTPVPNSKAMPIMVESSDDLELEYNDTDDESVIELPVTPKKTKPVAKKFDVDLEYPHYWTEVLSPVTSQYLAIDAVVKGIMATNRELIESLEPRGSKADKSRQVMAYIVGYSQDGTAKDVTVRYLKRQIMPGRTKGVRMPPVKIPIYNRHGKVKGYEHYDWFKSALSGYSRGSKGHPITDVDEQENSADLKPMKPERKEVKEGEETLQYYKQSAEFVLERHLKREEALRPGSEHVKIFRNKVKGGKMEAENVYLRSDVVPLKSAETWHKQGRAPLAGTEPLKRVPYRAATINRRREIMEAEAATGAKVLQGLYSFEQTDWIIPAPIKDGIIPKNEYGNIDLFMEHMCPEGAVHVPFRGAMRVCKRLKIDYAEAVVDFEFGHRMAVPVIQGVVVAEEHHDTVMEELRKDEAERTRKEDEKRRKGALGRWRKFLMGMRIVERIRQEYGEIGDDVSVFKHGSTAAGRDAPEPDTNEATAAMADGDEDMAGGFLPEGHEDGEPEEEQHQTSTFFPTMDEDEAPGEDDLIVEDGRLTERQQASTMAQASSSSSSTLRPGRPPAKGKGKAVSAPRKRAEKPATRQSSRGRRKATYDEDDDGDDNGDEDGEDGDEDEWANPDDDGED